MLAIIPLTATDFPDPVEHLHRWGILERSKVRAVQWPPSLENFEEIFWFGLRLFPEFTEGNGRNLKVKVLQFRLEDLPDLNPNILGRQS